MHAQEIIRSIEAEQMKSNLPTLYIGDTVKVGVIIQEGGKSGRSPMRVSSSLVAVLVLIKT